MATITEIDAAANRVLDAAHGRRTDSDENRMEWCCAKVPLALEQLSL
jgi:hypothetical protein